MGRGCANNTTDKLNLTSRHRRLDDTLHSSPLPCSSSSPCTPPKPPIRMRGHMPRLLVSGSKYNISRLPCTGRGLSCQEKSWVEGRFPPNARRAYRCSFRKPERKGFPRSLGRGRQTPSSRKSELADRKVRISVRWMVQDARIPNQSMVIVGNSPNMAPYEKPTNKLAFQRSFTSTMDMATS